jgi:hypothetical protein
VRKIGHWIEALGKTKAKWLIAIFLGIPTGLIASFCLVEFWSESTILKVLIAGICVALAVGIYRSLLSLISIKGSTTQIKLLSFGFILIAIWAPALMIWESLIADKLILFPSQVSIELIGRHGESGQLKINKVYLEGSSRRFTPISIGNNCVVLGGLITSAPEKVCEIGFLVTTHRQNRLNFEFDLSQTDGVVDLLTPTGDHHYEFEPVSERAKSGVFPVQIDSLSRTVKYPVYVVTWLSIFLMLMVVSLAGFSVFLRLLKPGRKSIKISETWAFILFVIIALVYANARFGSNISQTIGLPSDAGNISSFVAASEHPQNFVKDELLSNPENFSEYFALHLPLISGLAKVTGGYASAFMALLAPVTFIQLCGYYLLGKRILNNRLLAFLFAISTAIPINLPLFEYFGLSSEILPRSLFQAVLPYALLLLLALDDRPKYYWLVSLAFTLLLYVHPVSGPAWVGVCLVTLLYFAIKKTGQRWWVYWLPALLAFIIGVTPFLKAYLRPVSEIKIDPVLFLQIQQARYAPQIKPIVELYTRDMVVLLQTNWVALTLILVTLAYGVFGLVRLIKQSKKAKPLKISQQALLLSLWWVVLALVAVVVPLIDEIVANASGRPLLLREIRRTMRYFVPMLWLTFFWVCQKALVLFGKAKQPANHRPLVWLAILSLLICYGIETQIWKNPIFVRQWECLRSGSLICKPDKDTLAMYEFYSELPKFVRPDESVFPDPDPQYLGDSLIPRYHSLRSVAYTYKDGGAVGDFLPEWWRITQELRPYLPTSERGLDPNVVEVASTTGADYFYFIHPDQSAMNYLETQQVIFQNDYGTLISLK